MRISIIVQLISVSSNEIIQILLSDAKEMHVKYLCIVYHTLTIYGD
jgi:hypothetical protein